MAVSEYLSLSSVRNEFDLLDSISNAVKKEFTKLSNCRSGSMMLFINAVFFLLWNLNVPKKNKISLVNSYPYVDHDYILNMCLHSHLFIGADPYNNSIEELQEMETPIYLVIIIPYLIIIISFAYCSLESFCFKEKIFSTTVHAHLEDLKKRVKGSLKNLKEPRDVTKFKIEAQNLKDYTRLMILKGIIGSLDVVYTGIGIIACLFNVVLLLFLLSGPPNFLFVPREIWCKIKHEFLSENVINQSNSKLNDVISLIEDLKHLNLIFNTTEDPSKNDLKSLKATIRRERQSLESQYSKIDHEDVTDPIEFLISLMLEILTEIKKKSFRSETNEIIESLKYNVRFLKGKEDKDSNVKSYGFVSISAIKDTLDKLYDSFKPVTDVSDEYKQILLIQGVINVINLLKNSNIRIIKALINQLFNGCIT
ncbi:MAG: hypothetical protein MHPSP_000971 [Paramarteilia canceri]